MTRADKRMARDAEHERHMRQMMVYTETPIDPPIVLMPGDQIAVPQAPREVFLPVNRAARRAAARKKR